MRPLFRGVAESIVNGNYFLFFIHLYAELAHLVERHLAKVEVASSSLVFRSMFCESCFRLQLGRLFVFMFFLFVDNHTGYMYN